MLTRAHRHHPKIIHRNSPGTCMRQLGCEEINKFFPLNTMIHGAVDSSTTEVHEEPTIVVFPLNGSLCAGNFIEHFLSQKSKSVVIENCLLQRPVLTKHILVLPDNACVAIQPMSNESMQRNVHMVEKKKTMDSATKTLILASEVFGEQESGVSRHTVPSGLRKIDQEQTMDSATKTLFVSSEVVGVEGGGVSRHTVPSGLRKIDQEQTMDSATKTLFVSSEVVGVEGGGVSRHTVPSGLRKIDQEQTMDSATKTLFVSSEVVGVEGGGVSRHTVPSGLRKIDQEQTMDSATKTLFVSSEVVGVEGGGVSRHTVPSGLRKIKQCCKTDSSASLLRNSCGNGADEGGVSQHSDTLSPRNIHQNKPTESSTSQLSNQRSKAVGATKSGVCWHQDTLGLRKDDQKQPYVDWTSLEEFLIDGCAQKGKVVVGGGGWTLQGQMYTRPQEKTTKTKTKTTTTTTKTTTTTTNGNASTFNMRYDEWDGAEQPRRPRQGEDTRRQEQAVNNSLPRDVREPKQLVREVARTRPTATPSNTRLRSILPPSRKPKLILSGLLSSPLPDPTNAWMSSDEVDAGFKLLFRNDNPAIDFISSACSSLSLETIYTEITRRFRRPQTQAVYFPWSIENHWYLVTFGLAYTMVYDPLMQKVPEVIGKLADLLRKPARLVRKGSTGAHQQKDAYNCAIYCLKYAAFKLSNTMWIVEEKTPDECRHVLLKQLLQVYDLEKDGQCVDLETINTFHCNMQKSTTNDIGKLKRRHKSSEKTSKRRCVPRGEVDTDSATDSSTTENMFGPTSLAKNTPTFDFILLTEMSLQRKHVVDEVHRVMSMWREGHYDSPTVKIGVLHSKQPNLHNNGGYWQVQFYGEEGRSFAQWLNREGMMRFSEHNKMFRSVSTKFYIIPRKSPVDVAENIFLYRVSLSNVKIGFAGTELKFYNNGIDAIKSLSFSEVVSDEQLKVASQNAYRMLNNSGKKLTTRVFRRAGIRVDDWMADNH